jgi:hypothetical protein
MSVKNEVEFDVFIYRERCYIAAKHIQQLDESEKGKETRHNKVRAVRLYLYANSSKYKLNCQHT